MIFYPGIEESLNGPVWTVQMELATEIITCPVRNDKVYKRADVRPGDKYEGSSETAVAIDPDDAHNKGPMHYKVFEDAHVESVGIGKFHH